MSLPFQYQSSGFSEPGIFVELYLPKRAKFQGTLYKTLTDGFDFSNLKRHFLSPRKKRLIQDVLKHHKQWNKYSNKSIRDMAPFYYGYSLYEVDGVFWSSNEGTHKHRTVEERTQVIRMMFLPDLDKIISQTNSHMERRDVIHIVKTFLRTSSHKRGVLGSSLTRNVAIQRMIETNESDILKNIENGNVHKILEYTEKWFDDIGLFLFGYLIFEICSEIKQLGDDNEVDYEEEIWLTSFWNLNVNRVTYRKISRGGTSTQARQINSGSSRKKSDERKAS